MKKKWVVGIITVLLILSAGFAVFANQWTKEIDQDVKAFIEENHRFIRHQFNYDKETDTYRLFHENDPADFREGLWHTIKDEVTIEALPFITKRVSDKKLKTDLSRAIELWAYAGENRDEQSLAFAYMILHDLDMLINGYNSDIVDYKTFGVTELEGKKDVDYEEMLNCYNSIK